MGRISNTIRNAKYGAINKIIVLIFRFVLRTIIIKKLGSEYIGLSSLFTSILQVLNLAELGIGSSITFSLYKPVAEKDETTIRALMNLYKKIYRIIGIVVLIIGLALIPFLKDLIKGDVPSNINIYALYLIYLINSVLTYLLFAYKTILFEVHQRNDVTSKISIVLNIFQFIFQVIAVMVYKNYYLYIVTLPMLTILNNLIGAYYAKKIYPNYYCDGVVEKSKKKDIAKRVYGLVLQKICATTRNSLDSIFISAFLGLNVIAIYNNYYMIMDAIVAILSIITVSMLASVGNSIATNTIEKNCNDMNKFNFMYMWISGFCTISLACLYQPFMELWLGNKFLLPIHTVLFFCLYFYLLKMGDIISAYSQGAGLWWEGKYRALAELILNILLNYFLGKFWGLDGIILGTLISLFLVNFLYGTTIIFKHYFKGQSISKYYLNHLKYFVITFIILVINYYAIKYIPLSGLLGFIIKALICLILPNILYFIIYKRNEYFDSFIEILSNLPLFRKVIKRW